jgi:hypothetical protein
VLSHETLVQKLIGKETEMETVAYFYFDEHTRVYQMDGRVHFLGGILKLLGNCEDAAFVIEHARIHQGCVTQPSDALQGEICDLSHVYEVASERISKASMDIQSILDC